ncbi:MAG: glycosyltransferase family 2 protein [Myxococcota bacterium]|nr:glycosyltransferase family 2 protein [Myxococcota bacterium]
MIRLALPAYNEEPNITELLRDICLTFEEVLPHRSYEIVVVDDGSSDATAERVGDFRQELDGDRFPNASIRLIRHEQNRGLAEAIRTGLMACAEDSLDRDIILTMDADNSHLPGLIPSMIRKVNEGHDVVIASRYRPGARVLGLAAHRRLLSLGASWLFRTLFPIPDVRDYTCGFRAYRAVMLKKVMESNPDFFSEQGFTCMVDILLKLRLEDPPVLMTEVPLLLRYDKKVGASKMNVGRTVRDTFGLIGRRLMTRS